MDPSINPCISCPCHKQMGEIGVRDGREGRKWRREEEKGRGGGRGRWREGGEGGEMEREGERERGGGGKEGEREGGRERGGIGRWGEGDGVCWLVA